MRSLLQASVLLVFFALVLLPWQAWFPINLSLVDSMQAPSGSHWLGTDSLGRDLLSRLHMAMWESVLPIWAATTVATGVGVLSACVVCAIRLPDWADACIRAAVVVVVSLPVGIVVFVVSASFQQVAIWALIVSLSILFMVRSFLSVQRWFFEDRQLGYWQAHEALGGHSIMRIMKYGALGRWKSSLLELLFFHLQVALAVEVTLAYLGFGVQEPAASIGNMLAAHWHLYMRDEWVSLVIIGICFTVIACAPWAMMGMLGALRGFTGLTRGWPSTSPHRRG